jgi:hypothetical protein
MERLDGQVVDGDVIGVAVGAGLVEGHDHRRPEVPDHRDDPANGFVRIGIDERAPVFIFGCAIHTRIAVAQEKNLVDADHGGGLPQLAFADLA